jgi:hypothetical protein
MILDDAQTREVKELRKWAGVVITWLLLMTLVSLSLGIAILAQLLIPEPGLRAIGLCVAGGTLGSSISALLSAADRISHGWEFSGGAKYPTPEPKDKFVARMIPFFFVRPFLGSAMGLLVYVGLTGGYLIAVQNADGVTFSPEGLLFLAFLGGLFAKTFLEKLRAVFDTLFGR